MDVTSLGTIIKLILTASHLVFVLDSMHINNYSRLELNIILFIQLSIMLLIRGAFFLSIIVKEDRFLAVYM